MSEENCSFEHLADAGNLSSTELWVRLLQTETAEIPNKVPAFVLLFLLVLLGLPGNVMVVLVYGLRFPASTAKTFIMAMSSFDLLNCLLGIPFEMVDLRYDMQLDIPAVCKIFRLLITLSTCTSITILAAVSVDRFWRICRPFRKQMSVRQSKVILATLTLVSILVSSPALVLYGRQTENIHGVTLCDCAIDDAYRDTSLAAAYQVFLFVLWVLVVSILVVMYSFIIYKIRLQQRRRDNMIATHSLTSVSLTRVRKGSNNEVSHPHRGKVSNSDSLPFSQPSQSGSGIGYQQNGIQQRPSSNECVTPDGQNILATSPASPLEADISQTSSLEREADSDDVQNKHDKNFRYKMTSTSVRKKYVNRLFSRDVNPIFESDYYFDPGIPEQWRATDESMTGRSRHETGSSLNNYLSDSTSQDPQFPTSPSYTTACGDWTPGYSGRSDTCGGHKGSQHALSQSLRESVEMRQRRMSSQNALVHPVKYPSEPTMMFSNDNSGLLGYPLQRTYSLPALKTSSVNVVLFNGSTNAEKFNPHHEDLILCREQDVANDKPNHHDLPPTGSANRSNNVTFDNSSWNSESRNAILQVWNEGLSSGVKSSATRAARDGDTATPSCLDTSDVSGLSHDGCKSSKSSGLLKSRASSVVTNLSTMWKKRPSGRASNTSKVTIMMFMVTVGFVLSYLPHLCIQVLRVLAPDMVTHLLCTSDAFFSVYHLLMRSFFINNALNPIIYGFYNKTFRSRCFRCLASPISFIRQNIGGNFSSAPTGSMDQDSQL